MRLLLLLTLPVSLFVVAACAQGSSEEPDSHGPIVAASPKEPVATVKAPNAANPVDAGEDAPTAPTENDAGTDSSVVVDSGSPDTGTVTPPPPTSIVPPIDDGTISSNEYGVHTNGQNQQMSNVADPTATTWYMTWSDTYLYVGVAAANVAEGIVLYIDTSPLSPSKSGTNANGSLIGYAYDNATVSSLPFRADFVAYIKSGYNEHRSADGNNGWAAKVQNAITVESSGVTSTREIAIPWSAIDKSGVRPPSFAWTGYAISQTGYAYGPMPSDNPQGNIGNAAAFGFFYKISDATPAVGTKPFLIKATP